MGYSHRLHQFHGFISALTLRAWRLCGDGMQNAGKADTRRFKPVIKAPEERCLGSIKRNYTGVVKVPAVRNSLLSVHVTRKDSCDSGEFWKTVFHAELRNPSEQDAKEQRKMDADKMDVSETG